MGISYRQGRPARSWMQVVWRRWFCLQALCWILPRRPAVRSEIATRATQVFMKLTSSVPVPDGQGVYIVEQTTRMLSVLNGWLKRKEVNWKECGDWSIAELRDFIRLMHKLRNSDFDDIYLANSDNRAI